MSGLRHAVERLSLRSDPKSHAGPHLTKTGDDGAASDWGHLEQRGSAATISHVPLVHLGSKANASSEFRPGDGFVNGHVADQTENGTSKIIKGYDAV